MAVTFENLISHNKRVSAVLTGGLIVLTAGLCGTFSQILFSNTHEFEPALFTFGAACGSVAAGLGATVSYFFGGNIIALISDARRAEKHDDPVLFNVVEEMSIAAGLPVPAIYVISDNSPNAFATGRDPGHAIIGITTGLRAKLNREELQAVIAHEMAHIKNYDIRLMMLVGVFAGIIALVSDLFLRGFINNMKFRGGRGSSRGGSRKGGAFIVIFIIVGVLLAWLGPLIARVLQLAVSREREYLADSTAVQLCRNPLALASALKKIALDESKLACDNRATEHMFIINPDPKRRLSNADRDSIWSTHPPLISRIARLNRIAGLGQPDSPG